jgi:hypothetical protein
MNFRPLVLSFDLNFQGDAQNIFISLNTDENYFFLSRIIYIM